MMQRSTAPRRDAERIIALARVALACSALLALWLDPDETAHRSLTFLQSSFVVYALVIWALAWMRIPPRRLPLVTHVVDIVMFAIIHAVTLSASSPYFAYFIFALFCAAIRWGWRGTSWTTLVVGATYLLLILAMTRLEPDAFDLNRVIVRGAYLAVVAGLLIYLGRHEERIREDIERLARWPVAAAGDDERTFTERIMAHAARLVGASRAVVRWEAGDEPAVRVITWSPGEMTIATAAPGADLSELALLASDASALSQTFKTGRVTGEVWFAQLHPSAGDVGPLSEIVAREIAASLDQLYATEQLREIATREERIRVARDLHDGVLQSLTGVRLELRAVASARPDVPEPTRDRLFAIERALAIEQRELRLFIGGLRPSWGAHGDTLAGRLDALRERIALEWKTPVTVRVSPGATAIPQRISDAIPMMVHEAVVNALKHAEPSRISVTIDDVEGELRIVVTDDGHGFPFRGKYDHEQLREAHAGPRSLLERVASLGGRLSIDSSETGSRLEMHLAL